MKDLDTELWKKVKTSSIVVLKNYVTKRSKREKETLKFNSQQSIRDNDIETMKKQKGGIQRDTK